jgi:hypothetical protein
MMRFDAAQAFGVGLGLEKPRASGVGGGELSDCLFFDYTAFWAESKSISLKLTPYSLPIFDYSRGVPFFLRT